MFERYTERARRTIFFARYEASQFGTPYIETEFLLLAMFREDKLLMQRFLPANDAADQIRKEIERNTVQGLKLSTSVDLPLSDACKRILAYALEEGETLHHQHVGGEHLLLGLLREEQSLSAKLLLRQGVTVAKVRESLTPHSPAPPRGPGIGSGSGRFPFSVPVATIEVSDVPRSTAFYATLGFGLTQTFYSGQIALIQSGLFQVALVHESLANGFVCLVVGHLPTVSAHLQQTGHKPEQQWTTGVDGIDSLLIRDPDNHLILLVSLRLQGPNT